MRNPILERLNINDMLKDRKEHLTIIKFLKAEKLNMEKKLDYLDKMIRAKKVIK